jgi:hydrogenase maturation factor
LVACSPDAVDDVLGAFHADGFDHATVIGRIVAGSRRVVVDAGRAAPIAAHGQAPAA